MYSDWNTKGRKNKERKDKIHKLKNINVESLKCVFVCEKHFEQKFLKKKRNVLDF